MEHNKIEVEIYDEKIPLITTESSLYVKEIAKYVDLKINQLLNNKSLMSEKAIRKMIMLGIFISDDLFKERIRYEQLIQSIDSKHHQELSERMEQIVNLKNQVNEIEQVFEEYKINNLDITIDEVDMKNKLQKLESDNKRLMAEVIERENSLLSIKNELLEKTKQSDINKAEYDKLQKNYDKLKKEFDEYISTFDER